MSWGKVIVGILGMIIVYSYRPPSGLGDAILMLGEGRSFYLKEPFYLIFMAAFALLTLWGVIGLVGDRRNRDGFREPGRGNAAAAAKPDSALNFSSDNEGIQEGFRNFRAHFSSSIAADENRRIALVALVGVIGVCILAAGAYWYFGNRTDRAAQIAESQTIIDNAGSAQINPAVQPMQPGETNPLPRPSQVVILTPANTKDIWTTSVYSYAPGGGGPGGGLDDDHLKVGGWGDEYWSLVQFKLVGLPTHAQRAILELYNEEAKKDRTPFYIGMIREPWGWRAGDRLWWKDRPTAIDWKGIVPTPSANAWIQIDITDIYNAWHSGAANYGIALRPQYNNNRGDEFYSSDAADSSLRPRLLITAG